MGKRKEKELKGLFSSIFQSRLKRCVTNARLLSKIEQRLRCDSCSFEIQESLRNFIFPISGSLLASGLMTA